MLHINDRVEARSGSLLGLEGYVTAGIHNDLTVSVCIPGLDQVVQVPKSELTKKFKPGDFVRVMESSAK